jgi:hypothetical protein
LTSKNNTNSALYSACTIDVLTLLILRLVAASTSDVWSHTVASNTLLAGTITKSKFSFHLCKQTEQGACHNRMLLPYQAQFGCHLIVEASKVVFAAVLAALMPAWLLAALVPL